MRYIVKDFNMNYDMTFETIYEAFDFYNKIVEEYEKDGFTDIHKIKIIYMGEN